jgi:hypothetical protein
MKLLSIKLVVNLVVVGIIVYQAKARGTDWREFAEATTGIFYYDAGSVSSPSNGVFRVWIHNVTKRETCLIDIICKEKDYRVLDVIQYDDAGRIKDRDLYYDNTVWLGITQRTVPEPLHSTLCP